MAAHNDQLELPGIAAPRPPVLIVPVGGELSQAESFPSMDALAAADLKPGQYELYRFGGTFTVEEIPARTRTFFQSAIRRPRKPRAAKAPRKAKE